MPTPAHPLCKPARALLTACLLAAAGLPLAARADDYSDVSKLVNAKQFAQALAKADQYLAGKPRDPQMRFIKGVILTETNQPAAAIAVFSLLNEDYPELPEPYNNLAVLYAQQNQFDKARSALDMALRTNPSYATAHENLGDVYSRLAAEAYGKALALEPRRPGVPAKVALIRSLFGAPSPQPGTTVSAPRSAVTPGTTTQPATPKPSGP